MANPVPFVPGYDYSAWQASNPTRPLPGQKVDTDFANLKRTTDETIAALGDIRRSDGKLQNGLVTIQSLESSLSALIAAVPGLAASAAVSAGVASAAAAAAGVSAASAAGSAATATAAAQRALENATGLVIATQAQAEAGVVNDKGMTPLRTRQAVETATQTLTPEAFGAIGDGVVDDAPAVRSALLAAAGKRVVCRGGAKYFLANPVSVDVDVDLDMNGAVFIAPKGGLSVGKLLVSYVAGAYLTTQKGAYQFSVPAGSTFAVGDMLALESDTSSAPIGDYKHGQLVKVVDVSGGVVSVSPPFYAAYQVDRIRKYSPLSVSVSSGSIDISGSVQPISGSPVTALYAFADQVAVSWVDVKGNADAGQGVNAIGMKVLISDCSVREIANRYGVPGGGRLGYGINIAGDEVTALRCKGSNCKHVLASAVREWRSRMVNFVKCVGTSPKGSHAVTATRVDGIVEAYYHYLFDCHANVEQFNCLEPDLDGVNSLISVRNSKAFIDRPTLRSRGVSAAFALRQDYLIAQSESAIDEIRIVNASVTIDDTRLGSVPSLIGILAYQGLNHGSIIVDGLDINDGYLFSVDANGDAAVAAATNIDKLSFRNVRGTVRGGIVVNGQQVTKPLGTISYVELEGVLAEAYEALSGWPLTSFIRFTACTKIGTLKVKGNFDFSPSGVNNIYPFYLGLSNDVMQLPDLMDFSGVVISCNAVGVIVRTANVSAAGRAIFDGMVLRHHSDPSPSLFAHGVYSVLPAKPSEPWTFKGARIFSVVAPSGSDGLNISATNRSFLDLDGVSLNTLIEYGADRPATPVGVRYAAGGGELPINLDAIRVDYQGNLIRGTIPVTSALPVGTRVRASAPAAGAVAEWIYTASGWKVLSTVTP